MNRNDLIIQLSDFIKKQQEYTKECSDAYKMGYIAGQTSTLTFIMNLPESK